MIRAIGNPSISVSCSFPRKARKLVSTLLKHYERRRLTEKAIVWGLIVIFIGVPVDYLTWRLRWSFLPEHIVVNVIQGILFSVFVWFFFKTRLERRFKEVGYLNHHIRNSLTTINLAEVIPESSQRLAMVSQATTRIQRCVEKISRDDDCEINDESPQEP
jgi:hypothetical protein